ncbi:MAG TPA: protein-L-isoaspartate(D-aspartate) O-methyltransferase [Candidatus Angelobacter sp.]|jgi:protein-L-isoaspartate(D-aspartate) O-methyltransferase|nr:protein-L-isoaspartate(D-aspartate) O-methyltransferase [Candidatus Angelobacter sp.]
MDAAELFRRWMRSGPHGATGVEEMLLRLRKGEVRDERVLAAMASVPRELFVDEAQREDAYADRALGIGHGQTISQPLMVALIVQALEVQPGDRALDVGTGSGYQAAVIAACGARVVSIERIPELAEQARARLGTLDLDVEVVVGDGSLGYPPEAPYDAIAVGAAAPHVPRPLADQLAPGGRLVVPVAVSSEGEQLIRVRRNGELLTTEELGPCRFVPLYGAEAYPEPADG